MTPHPKLEKVAKNAPKEKKKERKKERNCMLEKLIALENIKAYQEGS